MSLLLGLVVGIPLLVFRGYIISILWSWFVVDLGLPFISVPQAVGLSVLVNLFGRNKREEDIDTETMVKDLGFHFFYSLIALSCGWISHLFM